MDQDQNEDICIQVVDKIIDQFKNIKECDNIFIINKIENVGNIMRTYDELVDLANLYKSTKNTKILIDIIYKQNKLFLELEDKNNDSVLDGSDQDDPFEYIGDGGETDNETEDSDADGLYGNLGLLNFHNEINQDTKKEELDFFWNNEFDISLVQLYENKFHYVDMLDTFVYSCSKY